MQGKGLRSALAVAFIAIAAMAIGGCGSGGSDSNLTSRSAQDSTTSSDGSSQSAKRGSATENKSGGGNTNSSGASDTNPSTSHVNAKTNANGSPLGSSTAKSGDNSIQTYGFSATATEKSAAIAAMRSFEGAIAAHDYAKVCTMISAAYRDQLQQIASQPSLKGKGCAAALSGLLGRQASAARRAARGAVASVRVGGGNAFVLFRPAAGGPLSYFVLKLEDGKWKAIGLSTGTPLNPGV
jgi:hypothetical protein